MEDAVRWILLGCPGQEVIGSMVIGSVGDFTPRNTPYISRGNNPLILTIDPNFLGHPSGGLDAMPLEDGRAKWMVISG